MLKHYFRLQDNGSLNFLKTLPLGLKSLQFSQRLFQGLTLLLLFIYFFFGNIIVVLSECILLLFLNNIIGYESIVTVDRKYTANID